MSQVVSLGHSLVADLALQASQMDAKEREQARADATKVGAELRTLADGSDGIQKALHQGEMHYADKSQELGSAAEAAESSRMYASPIIVGWRCPHCPLQVWFTTCTLAPRGRANHCRHFNSGRSTCCLEAKPCLRSGSAAAGSQFYRARPRRAAQARIENLLFVRQEDTVCSTQIPKVLGEKEWGTYSIDGLAINRVRVVARGRYWSARVFDTLHGPAVYH
eukprot:COSAG01_NODE_616_length_14815_cov_8.518076_11_plen_221_part_00